MNPWRRQHALARTTVVWGAASVALGSVPAFCSDPWWRAFGQQHVGWGAVDLALVAVLEAVQRRRMRRLPHPWSPAVLAAEERRLRTILGVNVAADLGYVALGAALWASGQDRPRTAGAGAAIVLQGVFLAGHDGFHWLALGGPRVRSRRDPTSR
ncbi:DUF6992 family protein [uncultured Friedmanniella sp.]|uniref:DUF6992 family protein n=1 Tax=uncultured Friedmanniella sp. TaxID=335381 RepID=UPI0035CA3A1F